MQYADMKKLLLMLDSPVDKLEMVMDFGAQLLPVPDDARCCVMRGCASHVEICRRGNEFYAVADSALVRGIAAIIISMVQGQTADDIKKIDLNTEFASLDINLGTARLGGVNSMISFLQNL